MENTISLIHWTETSTHILIPPAMLCYAALRPFLTSGGNQMPPTVATRHLHNSWRRNLLPSAARHFLCLE
ncbi:protein of unknown function [Azospirillum lipoferum 4B]|uniref:Uncharacterized protein n=1 Tax=Azospirillum lipoferum (strain 4B) TaxID=862719 RepID=G7Z838_AZOL4|nr:protein of unknown function [Azospirillum lipoferum 4B]